MEPTLDEMSKSVAGLQTMAPGQAKAIQARVDAPKQFGDHIQELLCWKTPCWKPTKHNLLMSALSDEKVMEQVKEDVRPGVKSLLISRRSKSRQMPNSYNASCCTC